MACSLHEKVVRQDAPVSRTVYLDKACCVKNRLHISPSLRLFFNPPPPPRTCQSFHTFHFFPYRPQALRTSRILWRNRNHWPSTHCISWDTAKPPAPLPPYTLCFCHDIVGCDWRSGVCFQAFLASFFFVFSLLCFVHPIDAAQREWQAFAEIAQSFDHLLFVYIMFCYCHCLPVPLQWILYTAMLVAGTAWRVAVHWLFFLSFFFSL